MLKLLKDKYILGTLFATLFLYWHSFSVFFTNDDFFLLKISRAGNFSQFLNFFNFTTGPDGLGMYRPLTTQVFYFLGINLFSLNPFWLHVISFATFALVVLLVFKFTEEITRSKKAGYLSAFIYAISASHFGHFYYLATFQEVGVTLFFLAGSLSFLSLLKDGKNKSLLFSLGFFILSLLSKETAVILPFTNILLYLLLLFMKRTKLSFKKLVYCLIPFFGILALYLYYHFFVYGLATGESYIWDFSIKKVLNTSFWYALWSFNIPEMLVDFVGPGLKFNPNLYKFWGKEITQIFVFSGGVMLLSLWAFLKSFGKVAKKTSYIYMTFCLLWFLGTLTPVIFLPLHKFTFYLTLPLVGFSIGASHFIDAGEQKRYFGYLFILLYFISSFLSIRLTESSHWITQGAKTAERVYNYLEERRSTLEGKTLVFHDSAGDEELPWSPTEVVKVVLSDNNFFEVFYGGQIRARYENGGGEEAAGEVLVGSRMFLGY